MCESLNIKNLSLGSITTVFLTGMEILLKNSISNGDGNTIEK